MVNRSFCELLGYEESELLDYRWQDLTHPDDLLQKTSLIFDIVTGIINQFKICKRYIRKDGSVCTVLSIVAAVRNPDGELQYLLTQCLDITEIQRLRQNSQTKLTPDLKTDIELALRGKEFHLEYEPIYCLKSGKIAGHEGLIRWTHPIKGKIPPLDWIPACEENALLMSQVCSYVVLLGVAESRNRDTWISVNVSPKSLESSVFLGLIEEVGRVSDRPKLFFEITERLPLDSTRLERLQALGYGIFLDDFGQGHSSLIQLLDMARVLHRNYFKIKIDGWFSDNLNDQATILVMAEFINILHSLGLEVIAECIETEAQLKTWRELGVDYGQGWFWR